ncbi:MAG: sensor domain-containing diguanylate cyclase [candidate division KSB1 bacterium]|jgi:diguanylate cyclase (GGDEF)-like protein|nr:sensor domain-containing diguanylate cyclase [candidate division KSB1 bacterium]
MAESVNQLKDKISGLQKQVMQFEELNNELKGKLSELYSLYQISFVLSLTFDLDEVLKSVKRLYKKNFKIDELSLMLLDDKSGHLKVEASYGLRSGLRNFTPKHGEKNIFYAVLNQKEHIYIPDVSQETNLTIFSNSGRTRKGAFLSMPLIPEKSDPIGVINFYRKKADSFPDTEIDLLLKLAEQVANVIEQTLLFKKTKELSITDELTGIYNRRYLNQRLDREVTRSKRYKRPLTAIMIDIDYFKIYNDLNGHLLGDEVLKRVAHIIDNNIRKADILARYGGEEFMLLLPEIDKEHAYQVAEKLRKTVENEDFPKEHKMPHKNLTISVGFATLLEDTYNAHELLKFADIALYEAKNQGRNRVEGYRPDLYDEAENNKMYIEKSAS